MSNKKTLLNQLFTNLQPPSHTLSFKHSKSQYLLPDENQSADSKQIKRFQRTNDYSTNTPKHKVKMIKRSTTRQDNSMRQLLPDNHGSNNISQDSLDWTKIKTECINTTDQKHLHNLAKKPVSFQKVQSRAGYKNCSFFEHRVTPKQQLFEKKRCSSIFSKLSDKIDQCATKEAKKKLQKPHQLDRDTSIFSNEELVDEIKCLKKTLHQYQVRQKNRTKQIEKLNKISEQLVKVKQETFQIKKQKTRLESQNLQLKNRNVELEKNIKKIQIEKSILLKNNAKMAQTRIPAEIRDLQSFRQASLQHQLQQLKDQVAKGKSNLQLILQEQIKSLKSIKFSQQSEIKALQIKNTILQRKIEIAEKFLEQSEYDAEKAEEHKSLKETFSSLITEFKKLKNAYEQLKDEHKKLRKKSKKMKKIIFGDNKLLFSQNDGEDSSQPQVDLNLSYSR